MMTDKTTTNITPNCAPFYGAPGWLSKRVRRQGEPFPL
jgi:hypothetical protein